MSLSRLVLIGTLLVLAACRGGLDLQCDEGGDYLEARTIPRVKAPEDLDDLETLKEMPVPEPSPRPERSSSQGCLEAPPTVVGD